MPATQQLSSFSPRTAAIAVAAAATVLLSASTPVLAAAAPQPAVLTPTLLAPPGAEAPTLAPANVNANIAWQTGTGSEFDLAQQAVFPPSPLAAFNIDIAQYAPGLNLEQQTRLASYMPGFLAKIHAKDNHNTAGVNANVDPANRSGSPSRRDAGCPGQIACFVGICGGSILIDMPEIGCTLGEMMCPDSLC